MGAHDISFTLDGDKTFSDVLKAFKRQQESDADENGHREGYSGDFQTVSEVKNHGDKVFNTSSEAMEYCLEHAQKWESVIAVKYRVLGKVKYPKAIERLKTRIENEVSKLKGIEAKLAAVTQKRVSKRFITCTSCKSRVNTKHLGNVNAFRSGIVGCPVCNLAYVTKTERKRWENAKTRIETLETQRNTLIQKARDVAATKTTQTQWLIAGWGAS